MFIGYLRDMQTTLQSCFNALRPGGHLVYVVGNSAHGLGGDSLIIAADVLIARLARNAGFGVQRIVVARRPTRRRVDSEFLRESIIFARRPKTL